tara:strand:- start:1389 stop:1667 length:279 start_codon:yes stop_codon:yes gene_type:complete
MKLKITDQLAVGYEQEDFLLINQDGDVAAVSGNTEFNDLGVKIPAGEYLVAQVLGGEEGQLGCTLNVIGCQWHHENEVQEYTIGNIPTSKAY